MQRLLLGYRRSLQRTQQRQILTPQEQALLDKQQHVSYVDMQPVEQQRLQSEVDSMWGQIPAHLQEKAQKMAGLR